MSENNTGQGLLQALGKHLADDQAQAVSELRSRLSERQTEAAIRFRQSAGGLAALAVGELQKRYAAAQAEAMTRLLACEEDADPSVELLKTQDVRDMAAFFFFYDTIKATLDDQRVAKSARVRGMIDSLLNGLDQAAYERFDQWHEVLSESMGPLLARVERERQSENGRKSRRGPSVTGGRQLVIEVRGASRRKTWHTAWNWLVELVERVSDVQPHVGDFDLLAHKGNSISYAIGGRTGTIKRSTFQGYWSSPNKGTTAKKAL